MNERWFDYKYSQTVLSYVFFYHFKFISIGNDFQLIFSISYDAQKPVIAKK